MSTDSAVHVWSRASAQFLGSTAVWTLGPIHRIRYSQVYGSTEGARDTVSILHVYCSLKLIHTASVQTPRRSCGMSVCPHSRGVITNRLLRGVLDALVIGGPSGPTSVGQSDSLTDRHAVDTAQASDSGPVFPTPPPDQTHTEHSVNLPFDNLAAVAVTQEQSSYCAGNPFVDPSFAPPVHTEELGNLPFHHGLNPLLSISTGTYQQCYPPPFDILTATQPTIESSILPHDGALQDAAMDTMHFDPNAPGIPMRVEDLSELLSIFTSSTSSQQHQPSTTPVGSAPTETSESGNTDVSMLSAENMTYADNMMEVWSTAPTSFESVLVWYLSLCA